MTAQFLLEGTYPFSEVTQHSLYLDRGPAHFLSGLRVVILEFLHFARGLVGKQLTEEFLKFMSPVCKESCTEEVGSVPELISQPKFLFFELLQRKRGQWRRRRGWS